MRILYSGPLDQWNTTEARRQALVRLGHDVFSLDSLRYFKEWPRLVATLQWRSLWGPGVHAYNAALVREAAKVQPDMVWIDQGVAVWRKTVDTIKRQTHAQVLHYTSDDIEQWTRTFRHYLRAIASYDVNITTNVLNIERLLRFGARRVVRAEFGFDPDLHRPLVLTTAERLRYASRVVFIGHWEPTTEQTVAQLLAAGVPLRIWGGGWKRASDRRLRPTTTRYCHLVGEEYVKALMAADVCLCILSKWNRNQSAGRTFEIPAVGRFLLGERTEDHRRYYEEGHEAQFFSSFEELVDKARHYLGDQAQREAIAQRGHERCLKSGYTHTDRVRQILEQL